MLARKHGIVENCRRKLQASKNCNFSTEYPAKTAKNSISQSVASAGYSSEGRILEVAQGVADWFLGGSDGYGHGQPVTV